MTFKSPRPKQLFCTFALLTFAAFNSISSFAWPSLGGLLGTAGDAAKDIIKTDVSIPTNVNEVKDTALKNVEQTIGVNPNMVNAAVSNPQAVIEQASVEAIQSSPLKAIYDQQAKEIQASYAKGSTTIEGILKQQQDLTKPSSVASGQPLSGDDSRGTLIRVVASNNNAAVNSQPQAGDSNFVGPVDTRVAQPGDSNFVGPVDTRTAAPLTKDDRNSDDFNVGRNSDGTTTSCDVNGQHCVSMNCNADYTHCEPTQKEQQLAQQAAAKATKTECTAVWGSGTPTDQACNKTNETVASGAQSLMGLGVLGNLANSVSQGKSVMDAVSGVTDLITALRKGPIGLLNTVISEIQQYINSGGTDIARVSALIGKYSGQLAAFNSALDSFPEVQNLIKGTDAIKAVNDLVGGATSVLHTASNSVTQRLTQTD